MALNPRLSRAGLELVKSFEGLRLMAARLDDGGWIIGYGHTLSAREGAVVTAQEAEALLLFDLDRVASAVDAVVFSPLNPNQFGALTAFAFNVGVDNFRASAVLKRVNEGAYLQAALALELWRKAEFQGEDLVIDALVRRRAAEKALFLTPPEGFRPVPGAVLRPLYDAVAGEVLAQASGLVSPAHVEVRLDGPRAQAQRSASVEAAARNVSERLEQLYPDEPPPPPVVAPPPAPAPEPEPESTPVVVAPVAPPPEPVAPVAPVYAEPEAPPRYEPPVPLFSPSAPRTYQSSPFDRDEVEPEEFHSTASGFGRRGAAAQTESDDAPARPAGGLGKDLALLVAGVVGVLMFVGAILAMIYGKATLANLAIGLLGVVFMAPAGLRLLLKVFGESSVMSGDA